MTKSTATRSMTDVVERYAIRAILLTPEREVLLMRIRAPQGVVHVERFDPHMSDEVEARVLDRFQWWSVDALALIDEDLTPTSLHDILARYLQDGAPRSPLELEVLVD